MNSLDSRKSCLKVQKKILINNYKFCITHFIQMFMTSMWCRGKWEFFGPFDLSQNHVKQPELYLQAWRKFTDTNCIFGKKLSFEWVLWFWIIMWCKRRKGGLFEHLELSQDLASVEKFTDTNCIFSAKGIVQDKFPKTFMNGTYGFW